MGILGKILLVLNLLIGGGFAYLAVQDWQGRQTITAAGLRHVLLLDGFPFGDIPGAPDAMPTDPEAEIPFVIDGPGGKPTSTVSVDLLKTYFKTAAGEMDKGSPPLASADAVPSQLAEVRRVFDVIKANVDGQTTPALKAQAAYNHLLLQAETLEERKLAQKLFATGKADDLAARLYARFERVLKAPEKTDLSALDADDGGDVGKAKERLTEAEKAREGAAKDAAERRARLAHLLVHLDPSAAWQKRVLMVVGVKRYARTLAVQTARFAEMTARVDRMTSDEEARFRAEYASLMEAAAQRSQLLRDRQAEEKQLAKIEQEAATAVAQLKTRLDDPATGLKAQLAKVKADVDQLLATQNLTEQQLFDAQRAVSQALAEVYRLEGELRDVERQRYGKGTGQP